MGRHGARWEGVLGSFLEVEVEAPWGRGPKVLAAALEEVRRLEGVFSRHRESELTHLVRQGGGRPGPELMEVLRLALSLQEATGGAFHPAPRHGGEALRFQGEEVAILAPLDLDGLAKGLHRRQGGGGRPKGGGPGRLGEPGRDLARQGPGEAESWWKTPWVPITPPPPSASASAKGGWPPAGCATRGPTSWTPAP
ncbi:FAD:protein FMN transferase [Thermus sp. 2.9]|uniref:FAD:protein FMN transferase n=1 Tax=Thermus sp. (strain 2.9) TaxID=1577051 RepID=UPI000ABEDD24|nr:FAD:protein FMN transferase [Thermus sp. 2.9]